jgi:hypothetical protein
VKSLRLKSVTYNATALRIGSLCANHTDWALYVFKMCVHKDEMDIKRFLTVNKFSYTANILIVNITIFYRVCIYHSNLVVICTADGRIQPMIVPSTAIPWFQPLVVGCQSRFIVDIGIKKKYRIQWLSS